MLLIVVLVVMMLIGGCDTDSNQTYTERSAGSIVVKTNISGATITVYDYDSSQSQVLATGVTDEKGEVEITLTHADAVLYGELNGGQYHSRIGLNDIEVNDGQRLSSFFKYTSGETVQVNINELTNVMDGYVKYLDGANGELDAAWGTARNDFTAFLGLDPYTDSIITLDTLPAGTPVSNGLMYSFLLNAYELLAATTAEESGGDPVVLNVFYLSDLMHRDILADGVLDGMGFAYDGTTVAQLAMGTVFLNSNLYTTELGRTVIRAVRAESTADGQIPNELVGRVTSLATNTNPIIGATSRDALDLVGPSVSIEGYTEGEYRNGILLYTVRISDLVGVKEYSFDLDGNAFEPVVSTGENSVQVRIDTQAYPDGGHTLGVRAVDTMENVTYQTFEVNFDNSGPLAEVTSPLLVNTTNYTLSGVIHDNGGGVAEVQVNGALASIREGAFTAPLSLADGANTIQLLTTDTLGNSNETTVSVSVDLLPPVVNVDYSDAKYIKNGITYSDSLSFSVTQSNPDPLYMLTNNTVLAGTPVTESALTERQIPFVKIALHDDVGSAVFSPAADMQLSMDYQIGNRVVFENKPINPALVDAQKLFLLPLVTEYLTQEWYSAAMTDLHKITLRAVDQAGNETTNLLKFKVAFVVPPAVIAGVNDAFADTYFSIPFANRGTLNNTSVKIAEYTIDNTEGMDFLMSLSDPGNNELLHRYEDNLRVNRVRLVTYEYWEQRFINFDDLWSFDAPNCFANPTVTRIKNLSRVYKYIGTNQWKPLVKPGPIYGEPLEYYSDALPGNPTPSPWSPMTDGDDHIRRSTSYHLIEENIGNPPYDYIKSSVVEYDYATSLRGIVSEDLETGIVTANLGDGSGWEGGNFSASFWNNRKTISSKPTGGSGWTTVTVTACPDYHGLYRRTVPVYEYLPGYPLTETNTYSELAGIGVIFKVIDDRGNDIPMVNNLYSVKAGITLTIIKYAVIPEWAVYDDPIVDYKLRFNDTALDWTLNKGVVITRKHDTGGLYDTVNVLEEDSIVNDVTQVYEMR